MDYRRQVGRESGGRPGWFLHCDINGQRQRYYVRGSRGDEFGFTQDYSLGRETAVMQVLHREGIPVPDIIAHSEDPDVTLMEFIDGENDFTLIASAGQRDPHERLG